MIAIFMVSCHAHNDDAHAHNEEGEHKNEAEERPAVVETVWTDKTELFVEFPALVVNSESRFAAHFTILAHHQAVTQGTVTVSLVNKAGKSISQKVESPSSPGIFKPTLIPSEAGIFQLIFEINTPTLKDKIIIEHVEVFANSKNALEVLGEEEKSRNDISFLKEQAWKIDFQTAVSKQEEIYDVINTSGVWRSAPSDNKTLAATTVGIVSFNNKSLTVGMNVLKGQILMSISSSELTSNNLNAEIIKAKTNLEQAELEYTRKKELHELQIVSNAVFEQIGQKYNLAKANYDALSAGYSSGSKQVTVPFNGFIKSLKTDNGAFVKQGDELVVISSRQNGLLEAFLSPSYAAQTAGIQDIFYKVNQDTWSSMKRNDGTIISVSKEVSRTNPMLSLYARVKDAVLIPEGGFTEVQLMIGNPRKSLVIPVSSLLEDYGNYSLIVQLSGESFERRQVTIGRRNGAMVEIVKGLALGEVVVSKGAFQVKMASMSGQAPAHGHAH
jgi:RND family efflux transporter MFP subunit